MTQAKLQTFADYLAYDDGTGKYYELTQRELVEVPPESDDNVIISRILDRAFSEIVAFRRVRCHQLVLKLPGQPQNRFPDLTVLRSEHLPVTSTWAICHYPRHGSSTSRSASG